MTSSLVGSEMCIRDSHKHCLWLAGLRQDERRRPRGCWYVGNAHEPGPVSYTHLTLPTICSV
eukprot:2105880-Prorocentrum_lima.AAC.1